MEKQMLIIKHAKKTLLMPFLASAILLTPLAHAQSCNLKSEFKPEQWEIIKEAYDYGEPYNLGYTLASISVIESNAGLYVENDSSESYGVPQIRVTTAIKRLGLRNSNQNREGVKNRLIKDNEFAFDLAVEELRYWLGVRGNWRTAIKSYNAGWKHHRGENYMYKVVGVLKELEKCDTYLASNVGKTNTSMQG
jgi:hypothetical protein